MSERAPDASLPTGITEDRILGGRVVIRQPAAGYRVGIDPVFLAAAVPPCKGRALDLGCGVGAAGLCLTQRLPELHVVGLEVQPALADLARQNVALNGRGREIEIVTGDLLRPPRAIAPAGFDLVMANPPFHRGGSATAPKEAGRAAGHVEGEADLGAWMDRALLFAKERGTIVMIHKPERLSEILAALDGRAGAIAILPLWPGAGKPAGRILLRAEKGNGSPLTLHSGMILHEADGRYTREADSILREGLALAF